MTLNDLYTILGVFTYDHIHVWVFKTEAETALTKYFENKTKENRT